MITSTLSQLQPYRALGSNFEKAIQYVLQADFAIMEPGKYPIDGDYVFAIVNEYTTKPPSACEPESHRKYADIQIMIAGRENFGYTPLDGQAPATPYNPEKDLLLYIIPETGLSYITLGAGEFIVFFPSDIHQPEVYVRQPEFVKKVVVKVAI